MTGPDPSNDGRRTIDVQPATGEQTSGPSVRTAPAHSGHWLSSVPRHLGRARTSTLVLVVLFVALFVLYLYVHPETSSGATGTGATPPPAAPTTHAPARTTTRPPTTAPTTTVPTHTTGSSGTAPSGSTTTPTGTVTGPTTTPPTTSGGSLLPTGSGVPTS